MSGDERGLCVTRSLKGFTVAAVAAMLSGCLSIGSEPPEQLISLTPARSAPVGAIGSGTIEQAIIVLDPDAARRIDVTRVPVQVNGSSVAYLKDALWVEKPARQFRQLLAETIRADTSRLVVEGSDFDVTGGTVLSGRLLEMGYDAPSQSVIVRYDAILTGGDGPIRSRRFESVVPGISAEALSVAPALNQAANDVAGQVAQWVAQPGG